MNTCKCMFPLLLRKLLLNFICFEKKNTSKRCFCRVSLCKRIMLHVIKTKRLGSNSYIVSADNDDVDYQNKIFGITFKPILTIDYQKACKPDIQNNTFVFVFAEIC